MLHRRVPTWAVVISLGILTVFVAGFFHATAESEPRCGRPVTIPPCDPARKAREVEEFKRDVAARGMRLEACAEMPAPSAPASFSVPANLYRRSGEFSCKVESVIDTYKAIDKDIKSFGGEISEMEIVGNDDGRQGRISCTVSTDRFNDFIDYVRKKGKVLRERIMASSKPAPQGGNRHIPGDDEPDPRELSLVSVQIMDEKTAKEVQETRGLLATSFYRSASHFLSGLAVLVELFGWIAPYLMILALAIAPVMAVRRLRRREAVEPLGAPPLR